METKETKNKKRPIKILNEQIRGAANICSLYNRIKRMKKIREICSTELKNNNY